MNLLKKPVILLAFVLFAIPKSGFAQYQFTVDPFFSYFTDLKRYDLGFTFVLPTAHFAGVTPVYKDGLYYADSTAKRVTAGTGIGGSIGLSIPFKATGHISCWAVNFHIMANMYTWTDLNERMQFGSYAYTPVTPTLGATTLQIAMPIGIDWKAGNDAIESKRLAFGISMGAGLLPNYNMTTLSKDITGVNPHGAFGVNPYVKLEGSVFLGIDIKVRVMYTLGDVTLIDVNKPTDVRIDGPFKVTSNSNLMLSLVLMPFSSGWYEKRWYSTHDTYNQHDRLN